MNLNDINMRLKNTFKDGDNAAIWAVSKAIWADVVNYGKFWEKEGKKAATEEFEKKMAEEVEKRKKIEGELKSVGKKVKGCDDGKGALLTPEERSEMLARLMDEKLIDGSLAASEIRELKDIFNLKAADQDIRIEMVDFRQIDDDGLRMMGDVLLAQIDKVNRV